MQRGEHHTSRTGQARAPAAHRSRTPQQRRLLQLLPLLVLSVPTRRLVAAASCPQRRLHPAKQRTCNATKVSE
jgi:hypothetical protein